MAHGPIDPARLHGIALSNGTPERPPTSKKSADLPPNAPTMPSSQDRKSMRPRPILRAPLPHVNINSPRQKLSRGSGITGRSAVAAIATAIPQAHCPPSGAISRSLQLTSVVATDPMVRLELDGVIALSAISNSMRIGRSVRTPNLRNAGKQRQATGPLQQHGGSGYSSAKVRATRAVAVIGRHDIRGCFAASQQRYSRPSSDPTQLTKFG
jgi:hypothetical protein